MIKNNAIPLSKARALAETSLMPLADIARETGLSPRLVGKYAKSEHWQRPSAQPTRQQIIARLWQSAGQNLESIEAQLKDGATTAALRDLAVLTKVMRDLAALDAETITDVPEPAPGDASLRAEILQRMQRMRALDAVPAIG